MSELLAVLCSDLHFSLNPPSARSVETDWYGVMERQFRQIIDLQQNDNDPVPLIVAGDIFDRWNPPPELINFVMRLFDEVCVDPQDYGTGVYSIPGQHDLPNHQLSQIHRSAYGSLVQAKMVTDLHTPIEIHANQVNLILHPFPWGVPITPRVRVEARYPTIHLAVVHSFIWVPGCGYEGAPVGKLSSSYAESLAGYDAAVFGDNHQGFSRDEMCGDAICRVVNCGTFLRRRIDEVKYQPRVGLLYDDGTIKEHYLDVAQDKFLEEPLARIHERLEIDATKLLDGFRSLGSDSLDFRQALQICFELQSTDKAVRDIVMDCMKS